MKLSILIATITERSVQFQKLHEHLQRQILKESLSGEIQVLSLCDNKEMSIGAKRQKLLDMASGKFIVFIDDDDWTSDDYVISIINAINEGGPYLDCIGFRIHCFSDERDNGYAVASNRYSDWMNNYDGFRYVRTIYHKTPVKREIACSVGFPDVRYGEDYRYSQGLKRCGLLKNEVFIDKVLYFYRYSSLVPHNTKYGIK